MSGNFLIEPQSLPPEQPSGLVWQPTSHTCAPTYYVHRMMHLAMIQLSGEASMAEPLGFGGTRIPQRSDVSVQ